MNDNQGRAIFRDEAISLALNLGADMAELQIAEEERQELAIFNREITNDTYQVSQKVIFNIYKNQRKLTIASNCFNIDAICKQIKNLLPKIKALQPDLAYNITTLEQSKIEVNNTTIGNDNAFENIQLSELAERLHKSEALITEASLQSKGSFISKSKVKFWYSNSHGVNTSQCQTLYHQSLSGFIKTNNNEIISDNVSSKANLFSELKSPYHLQSEIIKRFPFPPHSVNKKTGIYPVIISNQCMQSFWGYILTALQGINIVTGMSFLTGKIGKKIAAEHIEFNELPQFNEGLNKRYHDDEGVFIKDKNIISAGTLRSYLLSNYFAKKLGCKSTGNAYAFSNVVVTPGPTPLADLISALKSGYYITHMFGDGVNLTNGDFLRKARGYWIENGKIEGQVIEMAIKGNLNHMLTDIIAHSSNMSKETKIFCPDTLFKKLEVC